VWLALALTVILLLVMTILCYVKAGLAPNLTSALGLDGADNNISIYDAAISTDTQEELFESLAPSENSDAYAALAVIMTILLVFVCVMLIMWRGCIVRCIAIVKESCKVFKTIPMLVMWPLVTITALALVCTWGVAVPMYIFYGDVETYYENYVEVVDAVAEAGSGDTASDVSEYLSNPQAMQWVLFAIHAFGVIWFIEFVKACAWITMSGAVAYWYFFRDDEQHKEKFPVLNAARRVLRFHLGSAAFGSLIIAICQFIRYALATVDYYTKDLQNSNLLYKMAIKCAQCAMWCLQKTIEFISYFGFVYVAIEGYSFCEACRKTFAFLLTPKNAAQTAVNKTVEKLLVVIIAWSTPTLLALCCYSCLNNECMGEYDDDNNPLYPAVLTWVAAFFLSDAIALVFECTIDTIFLCSFKDAAEFDGKYMSAEMREAFGLDVAEQEAKPILTAKDFKDKHPSKGSAPPTVTAGDGGSTEMGGATIKA